MRWAVACSTVEHAAVAQASGGANGATMLLPMDALSHITNALGYCQQQYAAQLPDHDPHASGAAAESQVSYARLMPDGLDMRTDCMLSHLHVSAPMHDGTDSIISLAT